ncbi:hypothetical protein Peur_057715 [Populus x canadensis]
MKTRIADIVLRGLRKRTSEEKDYNVLRGPAMKDKGPLKGAGPKRVTQVRLSPVEGHKRIAQGKDGVTQLRAKVLI